MTGERHFDLPELEREGPRHFDLPELDREGPRHFDLPEPDQEGPRRFDLAGALHFDYVVLECEEQRRIDSDYVPSICFS